MRDNYFMRQGIDKDSTMMNIAACRLLLDIMPGLELSTMQVSIYISSIKLGINLYIYFISIYASINPSIFLYLSINLLLIYLSIYLSIYYWSIYLSINLLLIYLSIYSSINPSVYKLVHPYIYQLTINLSKSLSHYISIQEQEGLGSQLYRWIEEADEPLKSYATGILAVIMDYHEFASGIYLVH